MKTGSSGVDTVPGSVDTRPNIQKTLFGQLGQCVDILSGSVDTLRLKFQLMIFLDTWPHGDQGNLPRQSLEHSGRREEEREKGICIQRSRAVPPREEDREEEGEEEEELVIPAVLVHKEIHPMYTALVIDSVDTPIDGVDTGSEPLKPFHEDRVKCVDTAPGSVDTRPSSQETQSPDWDRVSTQQSLEHSGRREEEREKGICIQRSRAVPPREEDREEEREEEELMIAAVLVQKEFQPTVVLWCLSRSAQGLVNLLNSQVVYGVANLTGATEGTGTTGGTSTPYGGAKGADTTSSYTVGTPAG
ncbi:hypothetical protein Taro_002662 [Colocasia esculenta]|uniref:Uncharacterized protein n=1 Tax=Colocasia esculenta TaxID=4460 RepID=A0A843TPD4_COLES|nr:hypothetical protein [Colocasia esculenta]